MDGCSLTTLAVTIAVTLVQRQLVSKINSATQRDVKHFLNRQIYDKEPGNVTLNNQRCLAPELTCAVKMAAPFVCQKHTRFAVTLDLLRRMQ